MEARKEQQKPLSSESAPNNGGHTIEDPAAENIWSDMDQASPRGIGQVL